MTNSKFQMSNINLPVGGQKSNIGKTYLTLNCNFALCILHFKLVQLISAVFIILIVPFSCYAADSNNKYGISLAQPHLEDLPKVKALINSSGGDWGYVTLIIQENDMSHQKWQEIFDYLRELHLIPIIRLATQPEGEVWRRPTPQDADRWVKFLDSLNWVVKNRYIILFNEVNHGSEWGGETDAKTYAEVALAFAQNMKKSNKNYYVMLSGFDASAPQSPPVYEDEGLYIKQIVDETPDIFDYIDGWSSHSYPNPGFAGSIWDSGRGTIRTYEWELELLGGLGLKKSLGVYITETGWNMRNNINENVAAENIRGAFENVWNRDDRVKAVTPFVYDYQGPPFLGFSWKLPSDTATYKHEFYQQYYTVQELAKEKGTPEQEDRGEIAAELPNELVAHSNYHFRISLKNTGQAIWDKDTGYSLKIDDFQSGSYLFSDISDIKPNTVEEIDLYLKTNGYTGKKQIKVSLVKDKKNVVNSKLITLSILPVPALNIGVGLYPKLRTQGTDFEIQIFDEKEGLVFKKGNIKIQNGRGKLSDVRNIILGKKYRVVVLKPYYLPRQEMIVFKRGENNLQFKLLYGLDFNKDGNFNLIKDSGAFFGNLGLLQLLLP